MRMWQWESVMWKSEIGRVKTKRGIWSEPAEVIFEFRVEDILRK